ncbi:hypothetical protein AYL99_02855 [Fonsecaea erecta]|uniref:Uncharacterized protein n=1 Tax=Fonsecaea erecta TaxID=1367422 RepID=A0A178ZV20_9EURO|nr:hypothetical protein AYL99_02855 [Fonsecaea erecta]OAP63628.1 hypothetical protein AYL99_02855 [Fonsecaea erecta]
MDYSKSRYAFNQHTSSSSISQTRQLAYQIGTMSRSKIQKEAAKTVPHLHRLVCHAAVFDSAARFIVEHMHHYSPQLDPSSPLATIEEIEDVDDDFALDDIVDIVPEDEDDSEPAHVESLHTAQVASFNGYAQLKSPRLCGVVVTTTVAGTRDGSHWEDVESDSSSSTESDDDDDDYETNFDFRYDYDVGTESGYPYYRQYERQSDWKYAHSCSKQFTASAAPTYSNHSNDDQLLWSQQPHVWSPQQEAHLFVEAFS